MTKNNKKGFTLVELLAVIAILGLVLIVAVPKINKTMNNSKKRTFEISAKSIAKSAEERNIENETYGINEEITCESVSNISKKDFSSCKINFDDEGNATVTIIGAGSYEGFNICNGTKTNSTATYEECVESIEVGEFGKDSWETIVRAVKQAETNGTEYPYNVGDEKTIDMGSLGNHTIRVANKTKCSALQTQPTSKTACGFVLEFADIITTHAMNGTSSGTSTNAGGWPASEMRKYINDIDASDNKDGVIYNALPDALKTGIIETDVVSNHGSEDTTGELENDNFGSTDKLYLLSTYEVWGSNSEESNTSATNTITRQLDYYAEYKGVDSNGAEYTGVSTTNKAGAIKYSGTTASNWWLRSANSNSSYSFYFVNNSGNWNSSTSYGSYGVAPTFRLAN